MSVESCTPSSASLLLVVLLGVIYVWQNGRISDKQAQVTALQADAAQVEAQIGGAAAL